MMPYFLSIMAIGTILFLGWILIRATRRNK